MSSSRPGRPAARELAGLLEPAVRLDPAVLLALGGRGDPAGRGGPGAQRLAFAVVDVFTDRAFAGNPLSVVFGTAGLADAALAALAREFHHSETAFPGPARASGADYRLRIFTPDQELPFAGHPSIGAAWVLAALAGLGQGAAGPVELVQECQAGLVPVLVEPVGGRCVLTGAAPEVGGPFEPGPLLAAVGLSADDLAWPARARTAGAGLAFSYLPVRPAAVTAALPHLPDLRAVPGGGVCVLAWTAETRSAHVRVFAGSVGVAEDPATGSAALGLGAWLVAEDLLPGDGTSRVRVFQGVEVGRPSVLDVEVAAAAGRAMRCQVSGQVVAVAGGQVRVPLR